MAFYQVVSGHLETDNKIFDFNGFTHIPHIFEEDLSQGDFDNTFGHLKQ
jgi:hypothetical protein